MNNDQAAGGSLHWVSRWLVWTLGAAALGYLIIEHRPHLFEWLPYLIILACPLMHFFMHRGHHHGGSSGDRAQKGRESSTDTSSR